MPNTNVTTTKTSTATANSSKNCLLDSLYSDPLNDNDLSELTKREVLFWSRQLRMTPSELFSLSAFDLDRQLTTVREQERKEEEKRVLHKKYTEELEQQLNAIQFDPYFVEDKRLPGGGSSQRTVWDILADAASEIEQLYARKADTNAAGRQLPKRQLPNNDISSSFEAEPLAAPPLTVHYTRPQPPAQREQMPQASTARTDLTRNNYRAPDNLMEKDQLCFCTDPIKQSTPYPGVNGTTQDTSYNNYNSWMPTTPQTYTSITPMSKSINLPASSYERSASPTQRTKDAPWPSSAQQQQQRQQQQQQQQQQQKQHQQQQQQQQYTSSITPMSKSINLPASSYEQSASPIQHTGDASYMPSTQQQQQQQKRPQQYTSSITPMSKSINLPASTYESIDEIGSQDCLQTTETSPKRHLNNDDASWAPPPLQQHVTSITPMSQSINLPLSSYGSGDSSSFRPNAAVASTPKNNPVTGRQPTFRNFTDYSMDYSRDATSGQRSTPMTQDNCQDRTQNRTADSWVPPPRPPYQSITPISQSINLPMSGYGSGDSTSFRPNPAVASTPKNNPVTGRQRTFRNYTDYSLNYSQDGYEENTQSITVEESNNNESRVRAATRTYSGPQPPRDFDEQIPTANTKGKSMPNGEKTPNSCTLNSCTPQTCETPMVCRIKNQHKSPEADNSQSPRSAGGATDTSGMQRLNYFRFNSPRSNSPETPRTATRPPQPRNLFASTDGARNVNVHPAARPNALYETKTSSQRPHLRKLGPNEENLCNCHITQCPKCSQPKYL